MTTNSNNTPKTVADQDDSLAAIFWMLFFILVPIGLIIGSIQQPAGGAKRGSSVPGVSRSTYEYNRSLGNSDEDLREMQSFVNKSNF